MDQILIVMVMPPHVDYAIVPFAKVAQYPLEQMDGYIVNLDTVERDEKIADHVVDLFRRLGIDSKAPNNDLVKYRITERPINVDQVVTIGWCF